MADDEYEDLYGDLYPGEAEYGATASAPAPAATTSISSTTPLTEAPPPAAPQPIQSLASPSPAVSAIPSLADQPPQQQYGQQQQGDSGASNPPMHFAPGFAAQRQQSGQTGGVRPSDMPEEG
jgi:hypothetical protein